MNAIEVKDGVYVCPDCQLRLVYFSGNEHVPAHQYCPNCLNDAYDESGNHIALID